MASSSQDIAPQQPAIKQTRQWAAWTRQEEERFFTALRQVGKNFEKITYRVQSKNKDQVRHYYYRLVRRMNKLLDPQLCLVASNSKDTNSAMLRWWSLLEKSSCKASKLHLKPRRFKMFLDALEHQLLKDRRKNIRKRHSQGEVCSTTATANVLSQGVNRSNCKGDLVPLKAVRQRRKPGASLVIYPSFRCIIHVTGTN
ncbi:SANT domain-containing protein [Heracleum sosnowskyi]|uniref:SANT domain-containing protein n=1 Tax=Heracleum sosnowskyi TaxID=360622 RepID=A0AAD8JCL8_9APIA|nr:SANT domain-containing protein [Heracleum sosnowskyi]